MCYAPAFIAAFAEGPILERLSWSSLSPLEAASFDHTPLKSGLCSDQMEDSIYLPAHIRPLLWEICQYPLLFTPIYDLGMFLNCIIMLKPMHNDLWRLDGTQVWSTYLCIGHNSWTWSSVLRRIHSSWPSITSSRHREDATTNNKGCNVNHPGTQVLIH